MYSETVEHIGSVSWGTMRIQDLTTSFMAYLADYAPAAYNRINAQVVEWWGSEIENFGDDSVIWDTEHMAWLLNEDIWTAMEELAPAGLYFGAHPGDGSDYGYWEFDDDDGDDDLSVEDWAEYHLSATRLEL